MKKYTRDEVYAASLLYFQGDDLAAQTFFKYALQDKEGHFHEKDPDQMHRRIAKEFVRIEDKFGGPRALDEDYIYDLLKNFDHLVPQGSPMMGIGNNFQKVSLSNCFAYDTKVITSDGTYSIGELASLTHVGYLDRNNIKLLTKGKKRSESKWVPAEIKSFGDQKLRKLTLQRQGFKKSIFVTPGHRWFVSPKGRPYGKTGFSEVITDKLLPGDKLQYAFSQSMRELQLTKLSWFGIAHGIAYGDGECVRGNRNANSITLCGKKDEQLKKYFFTEGFSFHENTCAGGAYYKGGLPNFFKELPDISENRAYLLGWLAGYFAVDGTCTATGNVRFNSSREEDLMLVKDICNLFGIGTFEIKEQKRISNLTNKEHTMFTMHVMSQHLSEDFFILEHHRKNFEKADVSTFRYWNVVSVEETSIEEEVFCAVVPETHSFVLEDNILTGNCVVIDSPEDNMSSIMNTARDMANLYKRRYGVGVDISNLRPDGSAVNNSAKTSTGAWSFADLYSYVTRMVGQNNRRGALMITMDVRHLDIEKFITMKRDLTKVTGANVSIRLRDDFMKAVKDDMSYQLRWPVNSKNPKEWKIIQAKDLWNTIIESATGYGEPGLLFWDNILKYLPANCYPDFLTICVNPCGELDLSGGDSCRLISQNLKWYVKHPFTDKAIFDWDLFVQHVSDAQRLSDDLVELELERVQDLVEIAGSDDEKLLYQKLYDACSNGRRTGLGTHGLADCLARMGMRYDSDEAISFAEQIYKARKEESYRESVEMAKERGAFPAFRWVLEKDNAFIQGLSPELISDIAKYGRRNISLLTNAPTGSVALESQTSSGIEPVFKNKYIRRKKKNHDEGPEDTDFVDDLGDRWKEFSVIHHNVKDWQDSVGGCQDPLPDYFVESDEIDWEKRIEMQAAIQRHIDHSIASTINLPKGTTPEVVSNLYMKAWENDLKGVTVYVDGSRSGVLVSEKTEFEHVNAPKRPESLECDIHHVTVKGEKWLVFVGLMEEKPYEVFGGLADNIEIPKDYKKGKIIKITKFKTVPNRYDLQVNGFTIKNIVKHFDNPTYQVHTRLTSMALRHGIKPSFLVEQLLKDPDNHLSSFSRVLSRVIKRYILDGTDVTSEKVCTECGSEGLVYQEGCATCKDCGYAKCG